MTARGSWRSLNNADISIVLVLDSSGVGIFLVLAFLWCPYFSGTSIPHQKGPGIGKVLAPGRLWHQKNADIRGPDTKNGLMPALL
jgi:hypothetical protein